MATLAIDTSGSGRLGDANSYMVRQLQPVSRSAQAWAVPELALADEPRKQVAPVPIAGGDVLGPPDFPPFPIRQFLPGVGTGFDGLDAELNGITNFRGLAALGYTSGTATDNHGRSYVANTDNRVYQGEYVGAHGERAHGTFVEI